MKTTSWLLAILLFVGTSPVVADERPTAEDLLAMLEKSVGKLGRVRIETNGKTPEMKRPDGSVVTSEVETTIFQDGPRRKVERALQVTTVENGTRSVARRREEILIGEEIITVSQRFRGDEPAGPPIVTAARDEDVVKGFWLGLEFGRVPGDGGCPLWTIMRESGSMELLPETEMIDGVETHVLKSRGKYGDHKVWLDAASGGLPRRIEVHKHPGNLFDNEQLATKLASSAESPPDPRGRIQVFGSRPRRESSTQIDKVKIENREGVFVITGYEEESSTTYADGKESKGKREHVMRVTVVPQEFPEETFRFQIAIPNGTRVLVRENGRPVEGRFEWVDGKIQPRPTN